MGCIMLQCMILVIHTFVLGPELGSGFSCTPMLYQAEGSQHKVPITASQYPKDAERDLLKLELQIHYKAGNAGSASLLHARRPPSRSTASRLNRCRMSSTARWESLPFLQTTATDLLCPRLLPWLTAASRAASKRSG